eukprot:5097739-Karenia_brevis.AAC.1
MVASSELDDRVLVAHLRRTAEAIAGRAAKYDESKARRAWLTWIRDGPAKSLGRQHRLSRVSTGWIPSGVGVAGQDLEATRSSDNESAESAAVDPQGGKFEEVVEDDVGHIEADL